MNEKEKIATLASLVEYVSDNVKAVLKREHDDSLDIVLAAYNRMQEDEFDGEGYIFNINKHSDLKFLVDNEMIDARKIAKAYNEIPLGLFKFENGEIVAVVSSNITETNAQRNELKEQLLQSLPFIVPYVLMYVARCKEYQDFYEAFFTYFSENRLDPK